MPRGRKTVTLKDSDKAGFAHSPLSGFEDPDTDLAEMLSLRKVFDKAMDKANIKPQVATNHGQYTLLQSERALKMRMKLARKVRNRKLTQNKNVESESL